MDMPLKESLRIVNLREKGLPVPFDIEFIGYDSNKSRSNCESHLKKVTSAIKVKSAHNDKRNATFTMKRLEGRGVETVHFKLIMKLNGATVW